MLATQRERVAQAIARLRRRISDKSQAPAPQPTSPEEAMARGWYLDKMRRDYENK